MKTWNDLQAKLEELFESDNVYYQPPTGMMIQYPAIIYHKTRIDKTNADDTSYLLWKSFLIQVIDKRPDNPVIEKILSLPGTRHTGCRSDKNMYYDTIEIKL